MSQDTEILGYEVSRKVEMRLPALTNYPKIARALMAADNVTRVESTFDTEKRDEMEGELIGEACAKARKQADLLAKGTGVVIGSVYAVNEQGSADLAERFGFANFSISAGVLDYGGGPSSLEVPLFAPTTIELRATVSVIYKAAP